MIKRDKYSLPFILIVICGLFFLSIGRPIRGQTQELPNIQIREDFFCKNVNITIRRLNNCDTLHLLNNGKIKSVPACRYPALIRNWNDTLTIRVVCSDTFDYFIQREQNDFNVYLLKEGIKDTLIMSYKRIPRGLKNCLYWVTIYGRQEFKENFYYMIKRGVADIGGSLIDLPPGDYGYFVIPDSNDIRHIDRNDFKDTIFIKYDGPSEKLERMIHDSNMYTRRRSMNGGIVNFYWGPNRKHNHGPTYDFENNPIYDVDSTVYEMGLEYERDINQIRISLISIKYVIECFGCMQMDLRETERGIEARPLASYQNRDKWSPHCQAKAGALGGFEAPCDTFNLYVISPMDTTMFVFDNTGQRLILLHKEGNHVEYHEPETRNK